MKCSCVSIGSTFCISFVPVDWTFFLCVIDRSVGSSFICDIGFFDKVLKADIGSSFGRAGLSLGGVGVCVGDGVGRWTPL